MSHETFSYSPNPTDSEPALSPELLSELESSPQICDPLIKINDIYNDYLNGCAWDLASLLRLQLDSESLNQTSLFFNRYSSDNPACRVLSDSVKLINRIINSGERLIPGHLETMLNFLVQEPLFKQLCNH